MIIDGGILAATPSSVVSLLDGGVEVVRVGKGDVSAFL
jgi:tRNA A37 threonylcarbamoyladenosine synthetase subunit TsaC/SUA5/YrdC